MPARQHHFRFAFKILPELVKYDTKKFVQMARADGITDMFRRLWVRIGETEFPPEERLDPEGLRCLGDQVHGFTRVLVVMPPPVNPNECYYVVMLVKSPGLNPFKKPEIGFYSLEKSFPDGDDLDPKVICRYDMAGNHGVVGRWTGPMHPDAFNLWVGDQLSGAKATARS